MLKLVGWEPLPSLSTLRARAAYEAALHYQVESTTSSEPSLSAEASRLRNQPVHSVNAAGLTDLQQEAALCSPPQTSPLANRPRVASFQLATEAPETCGGQSDHNSEQSSEPGQTAPLEEGELPDAEPDDPESVLGSQQHALEGAAAVAVPAAASTAKRKRGERAGKRVRQRQARRLRNMELDMLLTNGSRLAAQAPKRLVSTKQLPTCKYFLFGKCSKGDQCPFPHAGIPITRYISCRFFQQGQCTKGEDCQYSHDNKLEPCKQLVLHGECRFGPGCHFSHEPLPEYAVLPLQEWFKEQDQLKQDRSDRRAQEQAGDSAHHHQHHHQQPAALTEVDAYMSDEEGQVSPGVDDSCQAAPQQVDGTYLSGPGHVQARYRDWTDSWQKQFAGRLQLRKKRHAAPPDPSTFAALSGPYANWNDGWKKLFTQNMSPKQEHAKKA